jgi:hypothetical protein
MTAHQPAGQAPAFLEIIMSIKFDLANLTETEDLAPLYCKYDGQINPQPAYVMLDEDGDVTADWSGEIGSSTPMRVWHGVDMRWSVAADIKPAVLVDYLQNEALPLLERVYAGHSVDWDGSNHRGTLDEDAQEASEELQELFDRETNNEENRTQVWTASEWLFSASNWLDDHWTNEDIDVVAESIEADAVRDGIHIEGSIKGALLDAAEQMYDGDKRLTQAQLLALYENDRIDIKPIVSKRDKALTVFINRSQASAQVFYEYDAKELDEVQWRATGYQTADMPMDDEAAVEMVSEWLDAQGG